MLCAVALCGAVGCGGPTTVLIDIKVAAEDLVPASLLVSVYDRFGTLAPLDERIKNPPPGRVWIGDLPPLAQPIRVTVRGATTDGLRYGAIELATIPERQAKGTITLAREILDTDGDFVPDDLDNCPLVPNPDQASESGAAPGNACLNMEMPDLVGPPPDDLAVSPPDLTVFDLVGADFLVPPDLKPPDDLVGADLTSSPDLKPPPDLKAAPVDMTPSNPSKCPGSGFLLCEDFETGAINTSRWPDQTATNATVAVTNARSYRGGYSLRVVTNATGSSQIGRLESYTMLSPATTDVFIRYYVYRESLALDFASVIETADSTFQPGLQAGWSSGKQLVFRYYNGDSAAMSDGHIANEAPARTIPAGVWVCVEEQIVYGTAGNAKMYGWINDIAASTADWTNANGLTITVPRLEALFVGVTTSDTVASTTYIDELVVSTTRIGCAN